MYLLNYYFRKYSSIINNKLSNNFFDLTYIVEDANWAIYWEGKNIVRNLNDLNFLKARITKFPDSVSTTIMHYGSEHTLKNINLLKDKNKYKILSWYHIEPDNKKNKLIKNYNKYLDVIHTTSENTKNLLNSAGFDKNKIVVIPIGVDLTIFKSVSSNTKLNLKKTLGINQNAFVIGSFQKDGVGWDLGLEPKFIKGPDVFVDVIKKINKEIPIHILLIGPARGYIINKLEKLSIPYTHRYVDNFLEISKYYQACDCILISSRIEGGPKQLLEGMATGIPIISTKVGMSPDVIRHNKNGLISEVEDVDSLVINIESLYNDKNLQKKIRKNGLETVKEYCWDLITKRYYHEIYKQFL